MTGLKALEPSVGKKVVFFLHHSKISKHSMQEAIDVLHSYNNTKSDCNDTSVRNEVILPSLGREYVYDV
jgi:hypothetical protein